MTVGKVKGMERIQVMGSFGMEKGRKAQGKRKEGIGKECDSCNAMLMTQIIQLSSK